MAINPAPHVVGQHSSKSVLNANWGEVAAVLNVSASGTITVTSASYAIQATDAIVWVNRAGAVTLTLPDAAAWLAAPGHGSSIDLQIQDISGAAETNNVTINRAGSDLVNGDTSITIQANYGVYRLRPAAANKWVVR